MDTIILILGTTLMYSSPLAFGALAGVISERSGVINLGIEGMMTIGAFTATAVTLATGNPWLGFIAGGLAGATLALLHAISTVSFYADQTMSGIAMNLIGPGVALFICSLMFDGAKTTKPSAQLPTITGGNMDPSSTFKSLDVNITVILALLLAVLLWLFLYKTKYGLRIRAIGEHPAAADTLGINVKRTRYLCVLASGLFAGLGGATMTLSVVSQFSPTVISGQGYIALAAVIFGKWTPLGSYGAAVFFGFAQALAIALGGDTLPFHLPPELLSMLPYIITILILILFVGKGVAPKADGIPYRKGMR
eukprot:TRINITY_DN0_c124_g1_i1.p1 TRINITY_DN0_c124_g1~~TRINITY_DN0_c124_g1_i1.p1  ORF type:complete len:308 (-),score=-78.55 TRINITY_DN0_c124_g1_i1:654-1577(-)